MPNVKIYVDEPTYQDRKDALQALLPPLRDAICEQLKVPVAACQLAVIPVIGMAGQPVANFEVQYLGTPERTRDVITQACTVFRELVAGAVGAVPAVRATPLDPETYVALK